MVCTRQVPVPVASGDGSGCDAFRALSRLVSLDPVAADMAASTPLFSIRGRRLTLVDITAFVRRIARAAGEGNDAVQFSGRSMRVGGATELAALGVSPLTIQLLGRWDSEVYRAYTRVTRAQALRLSSAMSSAGSRPSDPSLEALFHGYTQGV